MMQQESMMSFGVSELSFFPTTFGSHFPNPQITTLPSIRVG